MGYKVRCRKFSKISVIPQIKPTKNLFTFCYLESPTEEEGNLNKVLVITSLDRGQEIVSLCNDTARKTRFSKSWNIMESSKTPSKYHFSIKFLAAKKAVFPFNKKLKTRTFQQSINIIFPSTFWLIKRLYFLSLKNSKQELFSNQ